MFDYLSYSKNLKNIIYFVMISSITNESSNTVYNFIYFN
jgi:hypothetical protein